MTLVVHKDFGSYKRGDLIRGAAADEVAAHPFQRHNCSRIADDAIAAPVIAPAPAPLEVKAPAKVASSATAVE